MKSYVKSLFLKLSVMVMTLLISVNSDIQASPLVLDDAAESGVMIQSLAWSPDGTRIAVGKGHAICGIEYFDERFDILMLSPDGAISERFLGMRCTQTAIAWSPDGTTLVSTDNSASVWFWNTTTRKIFSQKSISFFGSPTLALSPEGQKVYGIADDSIYVYDTISRDASLDFAEHRTRYITSIALSPDASKLASGDKDRLIRILDTATKEATITIEPQTSIPTFLDWHPDDSMLAGGFEDGAIKIWDVLSGTLILELPNHTDQVSIVAWSPFGDRLATAGYDGQVNIWDRVDGRLLESFTFEGKVLALDWSPDGDNLVYGGIRSDYEDTDAIIAPAPSIPTSTPPK